MLLFKKKKNKTEKVDIEDASVDTGADKTIENNKEKPTFEDKAKEYVEKAGKGSLNFINPVPFDMIAQGWRASGKVKQGATRLGVYGVAVPLHNAYWMPVALIFKIIKKYLWKKSSASYDKELSFLEAESELEPFDCFLNDLTSRKQLKKMGDRAILLSKISLICLLITLVFFPLKWLATGADYRSVISFFAMFIFSSGVALKETGEYLRIYFSNNSSALTNIFFLIRKKRYSEILPNTSRLNLTIKEYVKMKKIIETERVSNQS